MYVQDKYIVQLKMCSIYFYNKGAVFKFLSSLSSILFLTNKAKTVQHVVSISC